MKTVELAVEAAFDASKAAAGFDDIGDAAKGMAGDVEDAARTVDSSADRMSSIADSADNIDSKAGQATASLGALSGGLEAVGATGAADALGTVGQATDFLSGAGQGLNLVLQLQIVQQAKAKAAAIASAAAQKAIAAATKAYAVVQWALNAALSANPIGLVVLAIAALVAGVILAYKKSETFRDIVQAVMAAAKAAVQTVIDIVKKVPDFIGDVIDKAGNLAPAFGVAKDLIVGYFDLMTKPLQIVIDLVQKIIDKIKDIDFPDIPDIPFIGRTASGGGISGGLSADLRGGGLAVNVNGGFVGNEAQLGRVIRDAVAAELRRRGVR